jgi:hypothetical protein
LLMSSLLSPHRPHLLMSSRLSSHYVSKCMLHTAWTTGHFSTASNRRFPNTVHGVFHLNVQNVSC